MTERKLDIFNVLERLDKNDMNIYESLSDDEKKEFAPLVIMRWMSALKGGKDYQESYLDNVNGIVNEYFWDLAKYPDLQAKLLALCGNGSKQFHQWIKAPSTKKSKKSKVDEVLKNLFESINEQELSILKQYLTKERLDDMLKSYGYQESEIKEIGKDL